MIGTLNEGSLHAQLKEWYAVDGDIFEQPVDGYVIDLVRGELLIEVQTGGFASLRTKLSNLLESHPVRLVAPIATDRRIVKLGTGGEILSARQSPKHGRLEDIFSRLVSIPGLIQKDRFELEVLITSEDEYRVHEPGKAWRRKGWVVVGRALHKVDESVLIRSVEDLAGFLPADLIEPFTTSDLAEKLNVSRRLAQQMTYCLRELSVLDMAGKDGNSVRYVRR
ncbi:MAG: hypothetical protein P1T08_00765 [Acidimicrobiia bacterium]|nr:hypothetical protein [Acidimicrobiia bacterium]